MLKEAIAQICADAKDKNRKHTETIKLQIGFKNYDPQKEKRFSGSVRLPHSPFGDAQHVEEVKYTVSITYLFDY